MRSRLIRLIARLAPLVLAIAVGAQSLAAAGHTGPPAPEAPAHERQDHDAADCIACLLGAQLRAQLPDGLTRDPVAPESRSTRLHVRTEAARAASDLGVSQSRGPPPALRRP